MAAARRKALMLCYYFPPIISSGVARSQSFAERLPRYGWDPIVLTVGRCRDPWVTLGGDAPAGLHIKRSYEWNLAAVVDSLHPAALRLFRLGGVELKRNYFRDLLCIPDTQIAWFSTVPGARLAAGADVVYASCSPFSSAVSGAAISAMTGKPLVVDFRDAWTLNPYTSRSSFHRAMIGRLERWVLRVCRRLILNTEGAARLYRRRYPQHADKIVCIPNGYDALNLAEAPPDRSGPFRIMHVGSFYGSRSPGLLLEALSELDGLDIEFVQVGGSLRAFDRFKGRVKITVIETVPRDRALELMRTASLLYLKQGWQPGVRDYIAVAAKTYEYLATGLPILAEVPPGDNADLVSQYAAAPYVVTTQSRDDVRKAVLDAHAHRHAYRPRITKAFEARFSRDSLTQELAREFDRAAGPACQP